MTILVGWFQVAAGVLKPGGVTRFVPRSVFTGFVNALPTLIFIVQLPKLTGVPTDLLHVCGQPSDHSVDGRGFVPLLATLGDSILLFLTLPQVPPIWVTLQIIFPNSVTLAAVGPRGHMPDVDPPV